VSEQPQAALTRQRGCEQDILMADLSAYQIANPATNEFEALSARTPAGKAHLEANDSYHVHHHGCQNTDRNRSKRYFWIHSKQMAIMKKIGATTIKPAAPSTDRMIRIVFCILIFSFYLCS
jgi:hypothetical protein